MKTCVNHPGEKAYSICHNCGKDYCGLCLDEGKEFYYCKSPECRKLLREELSRDQISIVTCPNCKSELEISEDERIAKKVHCPECEAVIDFNSVPPKILTRERYTELLSTLNQGDIALVKSMLDGGGIDYYVIGENFLSVDPLIAAARFYVNENQIEEVKEILKDLELRIWGVSMNH